MFCPEKKLNLSSLTEESTSLGALFPPNFPYRSGCFPSLSPCTPYVVISPEAAWAGLLDGSGSEIRIQLRFILSRKALHNVNISCIYFFLKDKYFIFSRLQQKSPY